MRDIARGHDGLFASGALAALAFHPEGMVRRKRASVSTLAEKSAHSIAAQMWRQHEALKRRASRARSRAEELACSIRALRVEQLALRYRPGRIKDHLRSLLRENPFQDHVFDGCFAPNLITNSGEAFLVDAWQNTVELEIMKYHGLGTGNTAAAEGDTALQTELTTQYNPDSTRATGSLTEASASVFRTVGTNTVDASAAVVEWALLSQAATGGGTLFSRVVFSTINLASSDSLQTTWDLTVE